VMYCMCTTLRGMSCGVEINIHAPVKSCISTPLLSSFSPNPHCHDHRHDVGAKVRRSSGAALDLAAGSEPELDSGKLHHSINHSAAVSLVLLLKRNPVLQLLKL
jgi:hypothetical protein